MKNISQSLDTMKIRNFDDIAKHIGTFIGHIIKSKEKAK